MSCVVTVMRQFVHVRVASGLRFVLLESEGEDGLSFPAKEAVDCDFEQMTQCEWKPDPRDETGKWRTVASPLEGHGFVSCLSPRTARLATFVRLWSSYIESHSLACLTFSVLVHAPPSSKLAILRHSSG
ncbi:hypothetical protein Ciccas_003728 [Cichlidogyrus casuarinus]|uniref:MAM domain-containing protein n=1 Tax=Cichlidogyrus casuarinus TaxID=1844966 RepID=A0ABD2QDJ6_9PLAT